MAPMVAPVVGSSPSSSAAGPSSTAATNGSSVPQEQQQATAAPPAKSGSLILQTTGTKILHPDEDISLVNEKLFSCFEMFCRNV